MLSEIPVWLIGIVVVVAWLAIFAVYMRNAEQSESLRDEVEALQALLDEGGDDEFA